MTNFLYSLNFTFFFLLLLTLLTLNFFHLPTDSLDLYQAGYNTSDHITRNYKYWQLLNTFQETTFFLPQWKGKVHIQNFKKTFFTSVYFIRYELHLIEVWALRFNLFIILLLIFAQINKFKGSVTRFFALVFFLNQFPPSLWLYHKGRFKFFRNFAEIFAAQGWHRWQMEKTFKQKIFNNFVWTPLSSRVNIYINFCL